MKEEYDKLKKKLNLPEFEKLDSEFEIPEIEKKSFLLRNIRRKMVEKFNLFSDILEGLIQPEKPSTMYESGYLSENDRKLIFELYKKLMFLTRYSEETAVNENEEKTARFIKEAFNEWLFLKKDLEKLLLKVKNAWTEQTKKEEEAYFG